MKLRWYMAGIAILLCSLADGNLLACGDKYLVPSRGMRFDLTPAARQQAAVLFYANPKSSLAGLFTTLSVDPVMRKAGYRPTVVASAQELDATLRRSSWDVVLLDVADGSAGQLSVSPSSPAVIAVAENSPSSAVATAKKQCATILKSPKRSQAFVQALDTAVAMRHGARGKAAKASC